MPKLQARALQILKIKFLLNVLQMWMLKARDSGIWWGTLGKLQLMLRKASQAWSCSSNGWCLMSGVLCLVSYVWCPMSVVFSLVSCVLYNICLLPSHCCPVSVVSCLCPIVLLSMLLHLSCLVYMMSTGFCLWSVLPFESSIIFCPVSISSCSLSCLSFVPVISYSLSLVLSQISIRLLDVSCNFV